MAKRQSVDPKYSMCVQPSFIIGTNNEDVIRLSLLIKKYIRQVNHELQTNDRTRFGLCSRKEH